MSVSFEFASSHETVSSSVVKLHSIRCSASNSKSTSRLEELAYPSLPNYQNNYESLSFDKTLLSKFTEANNLYLSKMYAAYISTYEKEIRSLDKLIARNSEDYRSLSKKGVALMYVGMYISAIDYFNNALKIQPDDCFSIGSKGFVLIILKKYTEATVCFDEVLKMQPENATALYRKSVVLKVTGKIEEAKMYFEKAVQVKPDAFVEALTYANALLCQRCYKEAVRWYDMVLEIRPDNAEAQRHKHIAVEELNHGNARSLLEDAPSVRLIELATPRRSLAKLNRDIAPLFIPPAPKPEYRQTSARLGELARPRRITDRYKKNITETGTGTLSTDRVISARLERLSTPKTNYGALNKDVLVYLNLTNTAPAVKLTKQYTSVLEKCEEKLKMYNKMLNASPGNCDILTEKGNVLRDLGNFNEAIENYDKALIVKPDDYYALDAKGFVLLIVRQYSEATQCFEKALKTKPDYAQALYHLSDVLKTTGKVEEAKEFQEKAVQQKADLHVELLSFANSTFARKHYEESVKWYDKVLEIKPDHEEALKKKKEAQGECAKKVEKVKEIFGQPEQNPSSKKFDVFLSYSWKQKKQVKNLFRILTNSGVNCWMDENQLKPGDKLFRQLADAISNSKLVIFCISNDYLKSVNCQREFDYTFYLNKKHIPVLLCKDKKQEFGEWPCHHSTFFTMGDVIYVANLFDQLDKTEEESVLIENTPLVDFVKQVKAVL